LLLNVERQRTLVPAASIQRGPQGTFLYVVRVDKTVAVRPVAVGTTEGDNASIENGLSAGEVVVVDGADKLEAGTHVRPLQQARAPSIGRPRA
jgi:membrane fusion protein, multidrug efflux system